MPKRSAAFYASRNASLRKARAAKAFPLPNPKALDPLPPNTEPVIREGRQAVAYHIPTSPPSPTQPMLKTTITLPRYSTWTSGLHFHTLHTEYLRLVQGSIFVQLDSSVKILSARAGGEVRIYDDTRAAMEPGLHIKIDKYARHNWGRAKEYLQRGQPGKRRRMAVYPIDIDDDVVVEEWTDPTDIHKPIFFWNLNGVLAAPFPHSSPQRQRLAHAAVGARCWVSFQLCVIFWELDNWPVFVELGYGWPDRLGMLLLKGWVEYLVAFGVLGAASVMGCVLGVRAVRRERTPVRLWEAYRKNGVN
ncbi:hypothetical protein BDW02DRAFT_371953 [Decorospora gaudefroyi]|uniref:Uncharacterized protein n=1 Tax=Decorospora gaudefroyi TaxID=184978 RepID=A0A6A5KB22_9PLEO|nr:hypothetical protein BDW02DRAFT_371953 [Decorospora gaudefroyi]